MVGGDQERAKLQFSWHWQNHEILHNTLPTDVKVTYCPVDNRGLVFTALVLNAALEDVL